MSKIIQNDILLNTHDRTSPTGRLLENYWVMKMLTVVNKAQSLCIGAATIARLAAQVLHDLFNHVFRYYYSQRLTRHARLRSPPDPRIVLRVCTTRSSPRRIGPDSVLDYVMGSLDVTSNVVHVSV
jgi:hypothetical protein